MKHLYQLIGYAKTCPTIEDFTKYLKTDDEPNTKYLQKYDYYGEPYQLCPDEEECFSYMSTFGPARKHRKEEVRFFAIKHYQLDEEQMFEFLTIDVLKIDCLDWKIYSMSSHSNEPKEFKLGNFL